MAEGAAGESDNGEGEEEGGAGSLTRVNSHVLLYKHFLLKVYKYTLQYLFDIHLVLYSQAEACQATYLTAQRLASQN